MCAPLRSCQHIRQVFYRPRSQQNFPVRLSGGPGECAGHQQQISFHGPVKLRKTQVVTDAQANPVNLTIAGWQIERHRRGTGLNHARFVVLLSAIVKPEKMNLVVARYTRPQGRIHQRAVVHMAAVAGPQRHRAAHTPKRELARALCQKVLHRPLAGSFCDVQLVGVLAAHQAKVLRQHGQLGARCTGPLQQLPGGIQVSLQMDTRDHLQHGDSHIDFYLLASGVSLAGLAISAGSALRSTLVILGLVQVPSM